MLRLRVCEPLPSEQSTQTWEQVTGATGRVPQQLPHHNSSNSCNSSAARLMLMRRLFRKKEKLLLRPWIITQ